MTFSDLQNGSSYKNNHELNDYIGNYTPYGYHTYYATSSQIKEDLGIMCPACNGNTNLSMTKLFYMTPITQILLPWCINRTLPNITVSTYIAGNDTDCNQVITDRLTYPKNFLLFNDSTDDRRKDVIQRNITYIELTGSEKQTYLNTVVEHPFYNKRITEIVNQTKTKTTAAFFNKEHPENILVLYTKHSINLLLAVLAISDRCFHKELTPEYAYSKDMYKSLLTEDYDTWYNDLVDYFCKVKPILRETQKDVLMEKIAYKLSTMNTEKREKRVTELAKEIRSYEDALRTRQIELRDVQYYLISAQANAMSVEDLLTILKSRKEITKMYPINATELHFSIVAPVNNYNTQSILNQFAYQYSSINKYKLKDVINAIFIEEKYILHCKIGVYLNINTCQVGSDNGRLNENCGIDNPHIKIASCFGNNKPLIEQSLINGNFELCIAYLIATCGNLNFDDSCVNNGFLPWLGKDENYWYTPCLTTPESTEMITLKDAFPDDYIKIFGGNNEQAF